MRTRRPAARRSPSVRPCRALREFAMRKLSDRNSISPMTTLEVAAGLASGRGSEQAPDHAVRGGGSGGAPKGDGGQRVLSGAVGSAPVESFNALNVGVEQG